MANDETTTSKRPRPGRAWRGHPGAIHLENGEQATIARAEVEDAPSVSGYVFAQNTLTLGAVRELIRATEIGPNFLLVARPLLPGHTYYLRGSRPVSAR